MGKNITLLMRAYGFTQVLDPDFVKWRELARKSRDEMKIPDEAMLPDNKLTFGQARKATLRAQVRKACERFHGVRSGE